MPTRAIHSFEGRVVDAYVGEWKTKDGNSKLILAKDGTATITAAAFSAQGKSEKTIAGEWKVNGSDLLLKYPSGTESVVLKYETKLKGSLMETIQAGSGIKADYSRVGKGASSGK